MSHIGIQVLTRGTKRAKWLTPTGGLTTKRIHAMFSTDGERMVKIAADVQTDNADTVEWAKAVQL